MVAKISKQSAKGTKGSKNLKPLKSVNKGILTDKNIHKLLQHGVSVLDAHKRFTEFQGKLEQIDLEYAAQLSAYAKDKNKAALEGKDPLDVVYPLVMSIVESFSGYLAEVYLSGYPLFPIVSGPKELKQAEQLEAVLDNHAIRGRYPRHLAMFGRDCAKYNFGALEVLWDSVPSLEQLPSDLGTTLEESQTLSYDTEFLNRVRRLDPYNTIWDYRVPMAEVATEGDYAGHVELYSRKRLKALILKLGTDALNTDLANRSFNAGGIGSVAPTYYNQLPQVSMYINSEAYQQGIVWEDWAAGGTGAGSNDLISTFGQMAEVSTLYTRIIPREFDIKSPRPNTPQIWKLIIINGTTLLHATPFHNARDMLPILIGQPVEDGFNYQTQSLAETAMPLQKTITELFNIRTAAAKRAISDRGLFDPSMVSKTDINSSAPAAKIPIKQLPIGRKLSDAYYPIPFNESGTASINTDISQVVQMAYMASGQNPTRQGQFHKGNRTKAEFDSTMSYSDMRARLLTIQLEHQVFVPMKEMLKFNILLHLPDTKMLSRATNEVVEINIKELRDAIMEFKIADGFTPSSKLASTDTLAMAFQTIAQMPQLGQSYDVAGMFTHLMSLGGIKGLDQYKIPQPVQEQPQQPQQPNQPQQPQ